MSLRKQVKYEIIELDDGKLGLFERRAADDVEFPTGLRWVFTVDMQSRFVRNPWRQRHYANELLDNLNRQVAPCA